MIEMLGVLAIIAVISIGSYSLYRRAVDTHKANSIFDDVNRFEFVISEKIDRAPNGEIPPGDFKPASGFVMVAVNEQAKQRHYIVVDDVPKSVCHILLEKGEGKYAMFADNLIYEGDISICNDINEMSFYFGDTSALCSFDKDGNPEHECDDGCLCPEEEGKSCKPDLYPTINKTKCCPNDQVNCFRTCRPACPAGMEYNDNCECECSDPMKEMDENGNCVCKTSSSSVALVADSNGNCKCSDARYIWISSLNKCSFLRCLKGDGGDCDLDGALCGYNCINTSDAKNISCSYGFCSNSSCIVNGRTLEQSPMTIPGGYSWGCRIPGTNCYQRRDSEFFCFNEDGVCCKSNNNQGICDEGLCDTDYCANLKDGNGAPATFVHAATESWWKGTCKFDKENVVCWPINAQRSTWKCATASGTTCSSNCSNPPDCGTCKDPCGGQGTADGDYCYVTHATSGQKIYRNGDNYYFKIGTNYNRCGYSCHYSGLTKRDDGTYTISSILCDVGNCQDPDCPNDWEYGYRRDDYYWGCVKDGIICFRFSSYNAVCVNSNGSESHYCQTFDTSDCREWSFKQCAPMVTRNVDGVDITKPACIYGRVQGTTDINDYDYDCWCKSGNLDYEQSDTMHTTPYCCPLGQVIRGGACASN